jgi:hypothetical protein
MRLLECTRGLWRKGRRRLRSAVVIATTVAATSVASSPAVRTAEAVALPDGRAYELVSPPDKNGGAVSTDKTDQISSWQSSPDGEVMAYSAPQPFAGAQTGAATGQYYLAQRTPSGWFSVSLLPPQAPGCNACQPQIRMYSEDLTRSVLLDGGGQGSGQDEPPLVAGEPPNNPNLFVRDDATGAYQLVDITPASATPQRASLAGATSDLSHVVFNEDAPLTGDAPPGENLYEWTAGTVRLVSYSPEGTPLEEALLGNGINRLRAISSDGSRIVFATGEKLYLREAASRTVQLDAPRGGGGEGGKGQFMTAAVDGSMILFTDSSFAGLTADTQPESGANLYDFDPTSKTLTDLTPASSAEVQGVLGASEDGAYVYFVAGGALAGEAVPGEPNLYVEHEGTITFIATLEFEDREDWEAGEQFNLTSRITPDGRHAAFESIRSLTGYDNRVPAGGSCGESLGEACREVFEYSVEPAELSCVSCNPSGTQPYGSSLLGRHVETGFQAEAHLSRNLSDDGSRVFFESFDALLPTASNGHLNVYEHERDGAGSCTSSNGCLYLMSTGTSSGDSFFEDASADGNDVFFTTDQQLVRADTDDARDLYDARVGGGFSERPSPLVCSGEACRPLGSPPPPVPFAASISFLGAGNLVPPPDPVATPKVKLKHKSFNGATVRLRVLVPAAGRLSASGSGVRRLTRAVGRAGAYSLTLHLTRNAKIRLRERGRLGLRLRVRYAPLTGPASSASVRLVAKARRRHG